MRSTLPAPAVPESDQKWTRHHHVEAGWADRIKDGTATLTDRRYAIARREYLYWQQQEDGVEAALARRFQTLQGWPGEVLPYPPGDPLNPRLDQMEATARWSAADEETRGPRPSMDPSRPSVNPDSVSWGRDPLPYKVGISDLSEREDYGEPG